MRISSPPLMWLSAGDVVLESIYSTGQGIRGYVAVGHGVEGLGGDFGDEALGVDDVAVEAELLGLDAECQAYHLGKVDDG